MKKYTFLSHSIPFLTLVFFWVAFLFLVTPDADANPWAEKFMKSLGLTHASWFIDEEDDLLFEIQTEPSFVMRITDRKTLRRLEFPIDENSEFIFKANPTGDDYRRFHQTFIAERYSKSWIAKWTGSSPIIASETVGSDDEKFIDIRVVRRLFRFILTVDSVACKLNLTKLASNQGTRRPKID